MDFTFTLILLVVITGGSLVTGESLIPVRILPDYSMIMTV